MRIAVFGATGGIGQHLVPQALNQGLHVTVLARTPSKVSARHDRLSVVQGDMANAEAVRRTIEGQDAVVCLLGAPLQDKSGIRASGTRQIVGAMTQACVRRLVCLSSLGAGSSYALLPGFYKYLIAPLLMERLLADHEAQEAEILTSDLDWIIARPSTYTDSAPAGTYGHGADADPAGPRLSFKISRADVADFLLHQLTDNAYLRRAAWLTH